MKFFILFIALNLFSLTFVQAQTSEISQIENLKILAEQGDAEAQYNLAYRYRFVTQNHELALEWYLKAARQGHAKAQYHLGYMYLHGSGVAQDYEKAFAWYLKAAEQGNTLAQSIVALMYNKGEGVPQDSFNAYVYANLATASGLKSAIEFRNSLEETLSQEEILKAQTLSNKMATQIEKTESSL